MVWSEAGSGLVAAVLGPSAGLGSSMPGPAFVAAVLAAPGALTGLDLGASSLAAWGALTGLDLNASSLAALTSPRR